ncbi:MAG: hypothetical protein ACREGC_03515, partial [Minisyncoccia bacterium]
GNLYAHVQTPSQGDFVGTVNIAFGTFSPLPNPTGDTDLLGHGIAFAPFRINTLYQADEADLSIIDLFSGIEGPVFSPLGYPAQLTSTPRVNAMDLDPFSGILYASVQENNSPTNILGTLNYASLGPRVSLLKYPPTKYQAPTGLDAVSVFRIYEECDVTTTMPGTVCQDCLLHETICNDGIDNDFDGLPDCLDPDCLDNPCNNSDPCSIDNSCIALGVCAGSPLCDDDNPCTLDVCDPAGPTCSNPNNTDLTMWGDCEEDGNSCTIGKCVPSIPDEPNSVYECYEQNRAFILDDPDEDDEDLADEGCNDGNPCTADSCVTTCKVTSDLDAAVSRGCYNTNNTDENGNVIPQNDFQCVNEVMENTTCFAENECT